MNYLTPLASAQNATIILEEVTRNYRLCFHAISDEDDDLDNDDVPGLKQSVGKGIILNRFG